MPWYQAVPLLGSAATLSVLILFRPSSEARLLGFTLLIGLMMLVSLGLAMKQLITAIYLAAWLSSG
jgi:hypothetical protein